MDHLQTESGNPASAELDERSPLELVRLMAAEDAKVPAAVATQAEAIARAVEVISERWRVGGRLIYAGAGTSGRLGVLDASECPPTFNAPPHMVIGLIAGGPKALTTAVEGAEDHPEFAARDLAAINLTAKDVVVGIATSGRTPYALGAVDYARGQGAFTIGFSCNPDADIIPRVDLAITPVVGPEVLTGSTRLKAGTATKLVLNMLTTGAMVRLGKTFGNLMVDMRATNEKLRARANRIVRTATGLDHAAAEALLDRCDRDLKTALVSQLTGVSADEARERLKAAGGRVRAAIGSVSRPATDPTDLVLGIDGGGTGTVALLADPTGHVIGRGEAGPSNMQAVGPDAALSALDAAVVAAFAAAGRPRRSVRSACLGLAGAGRPDDQAVVRQWADRLGLAATVRVSGVADLLLAAAGGWGVAVIAGTGSIAYARSSDGRTARAGGWGHLLGDEGSGYAIAVTALRAAARSADGRAVATALSEGLLTALGLTRPEELVASVYRDPSRARIGALAPVVLEVAAAGDPTADSIVLAGARELAAAVAAVAHTLELPAAFPVALAGGLLVSSAAYRERFLAALAGRGLRAEPATIVSEPAEGALRLAMASGAV
ncbi:MAG TPA: N-acetylmuramic acid 6-phosphate etherase [Gemmataceae bacterium]|nr:N-acetylmuramic acid 6-phosphate etherase [Gemmataceae bacterium]